MCTCGDDTPDYSVSPDVNDKPGVTPLHIACTRTDLQVIQFLLEKGAAINAVTVVQSLTPLQVDESILFSVHVVICNIVQQN